MIEFKSSGTKYFINPANILFIRENVGGLTYIAFSCLDTQHGEPYFLLVDGTVDQTAKKIENYRLKASRKSEPGN